jgi:hypothetical protein
VILGSSAGPIVEPAPTLEAEIGSAADEANQLVHYALSALTDDVATSTTRTNMLSVLRCCHGAPLPARWMMRPPWVDGREQRSTPPKIRRLRLDEVLGLKKTPPSVWQHAGGRAVNLTRV